MKKKRLNKLDELEKYLSKYSYIDKHTAYTKWNTFCLPEMIRKLKNKGLNITSEHDSKGRFRYKLNKDRD